jgi:hypothetical protein
VHELSVDLQTVDREGDQVAHRRIARSKVVDHHLEPALAQRRQPATDRLRVLDELGLREFHGDPPGAHSCPGDCRGDVVGKARVLDLPGGHVDVDHDGAAKEALPLPAVDLADHLTKDPAPDRNDQSTLLGEADELPREQQTAAGVPPAKECLETDDRAAPEVDHRLVVEEQLATLDGQGEVALELEMLRCRW